MPLKLTKLHSVSITTVTLTEKLVYFILVYGHLYVHHSDYITVIFLPVVHVCNVVIKCVTLS